MHDRDEGQQQQSHGQRRGGQQSRTVRPRQEIDIDVEAAAGATQPEHRLPPASTLVMRTEPIHQDAPVPAPQKDSTFSSTTTHRNVHRGVAGVQVVKGAINTAAGVARGTPALLLGNIVQLTVHSWSIFRPNAKVVERVMSGVEAGLSLAQVVVCIMLMKQIEDCVDDASKSVCLADTVLQVAYSAAIIGVQTIAELAKQPYADQTSGAAPTAP